jgi:group I intron endonuclease
MTKVLIYKITCLINNKTYIGQTIEKKGIQTRFKEHINTAKNNPKKGSRYLNNAILKHGIENFKLKKICKVNEKIKDVTEQFCISFYKSLAPNGYNLQTGGTHTEHSSETKQKRSESLKLLLKNPEKRLIWSEAKKGVSQGIKDNRKYEEDKNLPKYIRRLRGVSEGYAIDSHPKYNHQKVFTSKKLTMEEKYNLAIKFIENLEID